MPDRRCCACIFPRRSVRCLPGSARTAVGGRRDGCPGPSNSPSSVHRQRTSSRRSAPSIPTGHKKVFPIPGGHKKSVLFQGRFPAVWTGLEPATPCVTGRYSNQLNYHTVLFADANIGIFPGTANIRAIISQLFSHFLPGRPGQNNRCGLSPLRHEPIPEYTAAPPPASKARFHHTSGTPFPTGKHKKSVLFQGRFPAVWTGLEPATPCVTGRYSNQLNYHTVLICECKSTNFFRFSKLFTIFSADDLLPQLSSAVLELPHLSGTAGAPLSATSRNCNTGALPPKTRPPAMRRPSKPSSDIPPVERHGTHTHLSDSAHYAGATRGH